MSEHEIMSDAASSDADVNKTSDVVDEQSALDALRLEAADWRDKYLRKLAEFENFRKRTRLEIDQSRESALDSVLAGLLPVLDDFDRMLAGTWEADDPHRKGMELIRAKMWNYFSARGVERLEVLGKQFDSAEHEALAMQPTADFPPHTVMAVVAPGYQRAGRMIRHAQVIVSCELPNEGAAK